MNGAGATVCEIYREQSGNYHFLVLLKTGNGNEKAGITTFEFSAGRRQYCFFAIEYCVVSVLKANFSSARAEIGEETCE